MVTHNNLVYNEGFNPIWFVNLKQNVFVISCL